MSNLNDFVLSRRSMLAGLGGLGLAVAGLAGCTGTTAPSGSTAGSASTGGSDYEPVTLRVAFMPNPRLRRHPLRRHRSRLLR